MKFKIIFLAVFLPVFHFLSAETGAQSVNDSANEIKKKENVSDPLPDIRPQRKNNFSDKGQINVIGQKESDLKKIPGSASVIDSKYLKRTNPVDSMEALRRIPGAGIRYQDAAGLTPNISFRGVSNEESRKTLILEDGVFTSLSPYGQPESYYVPQINRMDRVEVVKGSGSILFGPTTLGGIINYVTRTPPTKPTFDLRTIGGTNGYFSNFIQLGGTTEKTDTAYDISQFHSQGNGFRDYQGFNVNDVSAKIIQKISEKDTIFLKLQKYEQDSQATYLGLTQGLYWSNPKANPARFDRKHIERNAAVIGHDHSFNDDWKLITRIYATNSTLQFRQETFSYNNINEFGVPAPPPANTYTVYSPAPIGNQPGDTIYMLNTTPRRNMFFKTGGAETKLEGKFNTLGIGHEISFGMRGHYESVNAAYNKFPYPFMDQGITNQRQTRDARAYSVYVQDSIAATEKFKIIPGVRYENIFQGVYTTRKLANSLDVRQGIANSIGQEILVSQGSESYTKVVLPGLGLTYDITEKFIWFSGAHTAFSPPTFSTIINPSLGLGYKLNAERSNNYETGFRGKLTRYFSMQVATYALFFSNQIINTNEASAVQGTGTVPVNAGKSENRGAESNFTFDFGKFFDSDWEVPLEIVYSYTKSISTAYNAFPSIQNPDGTTSLVNIPPFRKDAYGNLITIDTNRNYLPYVPRSTFIGGIGFKSPGGYFSRIEYQYFDKQYSDLQNTRNQSPDGSLGVIPAYGIWNMDLGYEPPSKKWSIFINGKNLENRYYISGKLPAGIQQGPYRQINIGATFHLD